MKATLKHPSANQRKSPAIGRSASARSSGGKTRRKARRAPAQPKTKKQPKLVDNLALFDDWHRELVSFKSHVETRPWREGRAIDRRVWRQFVALGREHLQAQVHWYRWLSKDELDSSDPRLAEWMNRLHQSVELWREAVTPLANDALFDKNGDVDARLDLLNLTVAIDGVIELSNPERAIELGDLTDSLDPYTPTNRGAKGLKAIRAMVARVGANAVKL